MGATGTIFSTFARPPSFSWNSASNGSMAAYTAPAPASRSDRGFVAPVALSASVTCFDLPSLQFVRKFRGVALFQTFLGVRSVLVGVSGVANRPYEMPEVGC